MKRLGIELGVLDGTAGPARPMLDCPGALLVVNRDEFDAYVRTGATFATARKDLPVDARGPARVACRGEVMTRIGYAYALCASCAGLEARHREAMRTLAGTR